MLTSSPAAEFTATAPPAIRALLKLALLWCLLLIAFGAFVRLSNAGLGCPDWPTCYGKATWPSAQEAEAANSAYPMRAVEHHKTWPEQVHRHIAAGLGLLIWGLGVVSLWISSTAARRQRQIVLNTGVGFVALAVLCYMLELPALSAASFIVGELILLTLAWKQSGKHSGLARWMIITLAWICFQALLGMWTVTWLVKPIIVTAHLLGGLVTLALIAYCNVLAGHWQRIEPRLPRPLTHAAVLALIGQLFLGGWVSTNYAALACPDFPSCQGQVWPEMDFQQGFVVWRGIGVNYEGGILDAPARAAVHISHRIGAIVLTAVLLMLIFAAWRSARRGESGVAYASLKTPALTLLACLALQIALGISNVVFALPLWIAVAHNAVAALLLLALLNLLWRDGFQRLIAS